MAAIRRAVRPPDFRAFRKQLRLYFCLSMALPQHPQASTQNLQTSRVDGGINSSAWQTGARVALFGMIVNSIFAVAKIIGGLFVHVYGVVAECICPSVDI